MRAATSTNIKERQDLSCALFDDAGRLIAQAAHIPVHLGAMPLSVKAALEHTGGKKGAAAALLGISWPTLNRKIREYGL